MNCPDDFELFLGLEEGDPALREHLAECEGCRTRAERERAWSRSFAAVRDPSPPAELMSAVLARMDAIDAARAERRQLALWAGAALLLVAAGVLLLWPTILGEAFGETVATVAALGTALETVLRSMLPRVAGIAVAVAAAQTLILLGCGLLLRRLTLHARMGS